MSVVASKTDSRYLTYEDYLTEGEINQRYDIIDGVRVYPMASPSISHQEYSMNLLELLRAYQRETRRGRTISAPLDLLISRIPLRTRQPDVFFISNERLAESGGVRGSVPLTVAPEIVIEILSGSDTRRMRHDKIADYCRIGVDECWMVSAEAETIEVLRLDAAGAETAAVYASGQTLQSLTFPDLTIDVNRVFDMNW